LFLCFWFAVVLPRRHGHRGQVAATRPAVAGEGPTAGVSAGAARLHRRNQPMARTVAERHEQEARDDDGDHPARLVVEKSMAGGEGTRRSERAAGPTTPTT
jgi:hypothetical protein